MPKQPIKSICVYCGASGNVNQHYIDNAYSLGQELAQQNITLIYGGANIGTMGAIANGSIDNGGQVIGVIPEGLVEKEIAHPNLTELHIVKDMHQRKAMMAELADAFIALPGGLGTLEELFEMLTWAQLGFHQKPIGLLNTQGFFDGLLSFLKHAANEQFLKAQHLTLLHAYPDSSQLLDALSLPIVAPEDKWW